MNRIQRDFIEEDLEKKMVFLAGPRQVGKTWLAKSFKELWSKVYYLNFDSDKDRLAMLRQEWDRESDLVVLDEYHKLKGWKSRIKGVYDTEGISPRLLVTGSARLDLFRKGGDSLAGRYFLHRLYPFSVGELSKWGRPKDILDYLMTLGGFPEPFLGQSEVQAQRWRKQHLERIIREDIQDLEPVQDIQSLILLVDLLRERVGTPISYASLARDIQVSPHTIKRWISSLEHMYVIFSVTTYHRNIARAILKEPKIYFYDTGAVRGDVGARLENAIAVCLRKWLHFLEDTQGKEVRLHFLRDKNKREVDFLIMINGIFEFLIEVKASDDNLHPSLHYFTQRLRPKHSVQLVYHCKRSSTVHGVSITDAADWLSRLEI